MQIGSDFLTRTRFTFKAIDQQFDESCPLGSMQGQGLFGERNVLYDHGPHRKRVNLDFKRAESGALRLAISDEKR